MLSIRLRRAGSTKKPYFRVVVTEGRSGRDSSFVENVGTYNPRSKPAEVAIDKARLAHWLKRGAKPSDDGHAGIIAASETRTHSAESRWRDAARWWCAHGRSVCASAGTRVQAHLEVGTARASSM